MLAVTESMQKAKQNACPYSTSSIRDRGSAVTGELLEIIRERQRLNAG
jgi:hypothetical protein